MEDELTIDAIRDWLKNSVTKEFFKRINSNMNSCDMEIHTHLSPGTVGDNMSFDIHLRQASLENAAMFELKEVLLIPEQMIEEIKEKKEEKNG